MTIQKKKFGSNSKIDQVIAIFVRQREFFENFSKRITEKFKVNHANTERMKTGSIITMQKLLNEDAMNS